MFIFLHVVLPGHGRAWLHSGTFRPFRNTGFHFYKKFNKILRQPPFDLPFTIKKFIMN